MNILVTGGAGYIGTHTLVALLEAGHQVVVVDNLCNSSAKSLQRVEKITQKNVTFFEADIRDTEALNRILQAHPCECCIHFAGLKAVGESVANPYLYYENNISGTLVLIDALRKNHCKNIIFSSSATVYGTPDFSPIPETAEKRPCNNPYAWTKSMLEQILMDIQHSDPSWNVVILRYFNPIGAHPSGLIGENPNGIPNNLMPYITQVAIGKRHHLGIFGNDYNTHDGTGVRDYIHVMDLARGHVAALQAIQNQKGLAIYNLGTGVGYSVMDVVNAFQNANNLKINYQFEPRRPGDIDSYYGDPTLAFKELGWKTQYSLQDMCRHSWNWQKNNPNGYEE